MSVRGRAAPPRQRELAAGNLDRHRHEILGAIQLEIVHLHRDGDVGDRVLQHQRVLELALLVGRRELRERLVGEIALPIGQIRIEVPRERHLDAMELAVVRGVRAVVADDVVARIAFAACTMPSDRSLLSNIALPPVSLARRRACPATAGSCVIAFCASAREHADAAGRRLRRVAERRHRDQPARVDRVDRDVRADRRVDGRAQLRLVVDAVQPQAAGEIDERLLLGQIPQHRRRGLQRRQLAIGVEDVELGIVLAECRAESVV